MGIVGCESSRQGRNVMLDLDNPNKTSRDLARTGFNGGRVGSVIARRIKCANSEIAQSIDGILMS